MRHIVLSALLGLLGVTSVAAQTFPSKPVTLVVPYSPGGSSDVVGRSLAQKLSEIWKQPVLVENRPGATTTIGSDYAARAPADGYTMLLAAPPFIITQYVYPNLAYTTEKNFEPVSLVAYFPLIMVVHPSLPINNLKELTDYSRSKPGMAYPSPGAGTTPHLLGEMLAKDQKLDVIHAPYKSGGQGVVDLIAGRLQFYAGPPTEVFSHIKAGKLRAIGVLDDKRLGVLPDVPTSVEQGYSLLQMQSWSSIAVPKGTPKAIVDKISADIATALKEPGLNERLVAQGAVVVGSTPEKASEFYRSEHDKLGPLVKAIGLKPEQ